MTASELLNDLRASGFKLAPLDDAIRVEPASKLTPELRATIRQHKPDLLAILTAESFSPTTRHLDGPTPLCPRCGGPTHDAADHLPGIIVLLCNDGERCRWGAGKSAREYREFIATSPAATRHADAS